MHGHPGVDRIWKFQYPSHFSGDWLKFPYSINLLQDDYIHNVYIYICKYIYIYNNLLVLSSLHQEMIRSITIVTMIPLPPFLLWMEEILHQLIGGKNPIVDRVSTILLVLDFANIHSKL